MHTLTSTERVIAYIDGFNLYFGLKSSHCKRYYWLDPRAMIQAMLKQNQRLQTTKYFTSRISGPPDKRKRQTTYIEALETLPDLHLYFGHYLSNQRTCRKCGNVDYAPNEKMTDVNIAVEMMADAYRNEFDTAILVSADSDLVPVVRLIKQEFPTKKIVVFFPPRRSSKQLQTNASAALVIREPALKRSQLPTNVSSRSGFALQRPSEWY